jgi:hypothetical protein
VMGIEEQRTAAIEGILILCGFFYY